MKFPLPSPRETVKAAWWRRSMSGGRSAADVVAEKHVGVTVSVDVREDGRGNGVGLLQGGGGKQRCGLEGAVAVARVDGCWSDGGGLDEDVGDSVAVKVADGERSSEEAERLLQEGAVALAEEDDVVPDEVGSFVVVEVGGEKRTRGVEGRLRCEENGCSKGAVTVAGKGDDRLVGFALIWLVADGGDDDVELAVAVEVSGCGVDGSSNVEVDGGGGGLEAAVTVPFVEEELGVRNDFLH